MLKPVDFLVIIFSVTAGWHIFWVTLKSIVLLLRDRKGNQNLPQPVSIIVCARNEEKNLKFLLPRLLNQDHPDYEVIIVLDRCFDESLAYLKSLEPSHPQLRTLIVDYVPDHFHPKKFGLTLGIKGAKNEWVLLTDADCWPASANWAQIFSGHFLENVDFVLGYSPYTASAGFLNAFIQYETFNTAFDYFSQAAMGFPYMGVGRNLAFRKDVFLKANGYSPFQNTTGGDDDLFVQQHAKGSNTALVINPEAMVYTAPKKSWKAYLQQKKRHFSVGKYYRPRIQLRHIIKVNMHLGLWVSFFILVAVNYNLLWISIGMIGILLLKGLFFWRSAQKLGHGYMYWITPILDLSYAFFIPAVGSISFFKKNIKWK